MKRQIALITNQTDDVKRLTHFYQLVLGFQRPAIMPWNQRTAFFADPHSNIHELFVYFA